MKRVGDKSTETVESIGRTLTGKVVYVHPLGRYYVVEFEFLRDKFRESFTGKTYKYV